MRPVGLVEVEVGSLIGRYRLVERIGGGVMTHVFTAYDEGADQTVALKLLYDDPAPISEIPVPDQLRRVLFRAMAKSPDDRYQHCAEALTDLTGVRRFLERPTGSGSGVPGSFRGHAPELRRRIAAFAGMVGL